MKLPGKNIVRRVRDRVRDTFAEPATSADDAPGEVDLDEVLRALPNLFGEARRRVSCGPHRTHAEIADVDPDQIDQLAEAITVELADHPELRLIDVNARSGRAIFSHPPDTYGWKFFANVLERAEAACDIQPTFPRDRHDYPSDVEPITRKLVELGIDVSAVTLGTLLNVISFRPTRLEFDLSQITTLVEHTPRLRRWLEERLGATAVDVGLGTTASIANAVGSGPVGPALDLVLQSLRLRGDLARRGLWAEREEQLCGDLSLDARAPTRSAYARPTPLPSGPIDTYADEALFASLGGFAIGILDTESLEQSYTPLLGGLPKAARYGHESFLAEIARILSERGILTLNTDALDITDRVDAVVVDGAVLQSDDGDIDPHAHTFVRAARNSEMFLAIVGTDGGELADEFDADEHVHVESETWRDQALSETIRSLQKQGRVVAMVGVRSESFADADLSIALDRHDSPAFNADILATDLLDDASFLLEACAISRTVSSESVVLAGTGAALGTLVALGGLKKTDPERVMVAVNAASVVAMANGLRRSRELEKRLRPATFDDTPWHAMGVEQVLDRLGTTRDGRLEDARAEELHEPEPEGWPIQLGRAIGAELLNPFTPILAGGAVLSAMIGSMADAAIVGGAVSLSAAAGGVERFQTERAVSRLQKRDSDPVTVLREGRRSEIDPRRLVVGDIVCLESGEVVPADCRIVRCANLQVDESALTGESLTVQKSTKPVETELVAERGSMLYEGTSVASGEARGVVVAVGDDTHSARAARLADKSPETGVESRLRDIAEMTLPVAAVSGALITSVGLMREQKMRSIIGSSVGLAVASVPEGLPLLATVAQLAAARRLAERDIIVRNPRTIEALGRIDVLCADKTGTLTEGRLRLHGVSNGTRVEGEDLGERADARRVIAAALRATPDHQEEDDDLPHATDQSVVDGARRFGIDRTEDLDRWSATARLPFGPERSFHAVLGESDDRSMLFVKGAPEELIPLCSRQQTSGGGKLTSSDRRELLREAEELAGEGLRVLCVARKELDSDHLTDDHVEDLTFVGFVTLSDPIRETSAEAVTRLREAGIATLMITGDHPRTALRIARDAGLVAPGDGDEVIVNGDAIEGLSDDELARLLADASIVARATPVHKVRIVRALQTAGRTVAMTGDGGNDASAIRMADVGIALGAESTKAARHAADMIVVDSHLETIVDGIAEGRAIWGSVRDAVAILIGGNLGEIGFTVASSVLSKEAALNTRQLLLVNLLTDIAPAIAIALRPPTPEETEELLEEGLEYALGEALDEQITNRAVATTAGATAAWLTSRMLGGKRKASTVGLLTVVGSQLTQTLSAGENTRATIAAAAGSAAVMLAIVQTPGISQAFGCRPVGPIGLTIAGGSSALAASIARIAPGALDRTRRWLEDQLAEDENPDTRDASDGSALSPSWPFQVVDDS